jgi:hypothetical protein
MVDELTHCNYRDSKDKGFRCFTCLHSEVRLSKQRLRAVYCLFISRFGVRCGANKVCNNWSKWK